MGFDELNILQSETNVSAGIGKIDIPKIEMPEFNIPIVGSIDTDLPGLTEFEDKVDSIREKLESLLPILASIGGAIAGIKIGSFVGGVADALGKIAEFKMRKKAIDEAIEGIGNGRFVGDAMFEEGLKNLGKSKTKAEQAQK